MKAYKGFTKELTCRGFQFAEGETYAEKDAALCSRGFHAVTMPLDALSYYPPGQSVYAEVELGDDATGGGDDSKVVSRTITIGARLTLPGLIRAQFDAVWSKIDRKSDKTAAITGDYSAAATTGDYSAAATTGDRSAAATTGYGSAAATTGYRSAAATTGDYSAAATTGYRSAAATTGNGSAAATTGADCISAALGWRGYAKAAVGSGLVVAEHDSAGHLLGVRAVIVDGTEVKAGTWYALRGGLLVEVDADGEPV